MDWNIIGHQKIIKYLQYSLQHDKLSHAYLFYGPRQLGKNVVVKQFAKSILCLHHGNKKTKANIPCGECEACLQFDLHTHADVYHLEKDPDSKNISVEEVRNLIKKLSSRTFFGNYKISIISGADQLSLGAANALLKTLEEPTPNTIIILTAGSINNLPKTILSRVQKIKFLPVAKSDIYQSLVTKYSIPREDALHLSSIAAGRPGRALLFMQTRSIWQPYLQNLNTFFGIFSQKKYERLAFASELLDKYQTLAEKNKNLLPLFNLWQLILRDILLLKLSLPDKIINTRARMALEKIEPYLSLQKIYMLNLAIEHSRMFLDKNSNSKLVLEQLLLKF